MALGRFLLAAACLALAGAQVVETTGAIEQGAFRKQVIGELPREAAPVELSEAFTENTSQNPYMHNGPTADALAFIFISVAIVICWIECCGAGKK